jgi:hypothetical protein
MVYVHLPCIGEEEEEETRTKVSLDLDTHVVIFVKDSNKGRSQKGGWRERVLNEMHNILGDASTLNLPNCMSIFVYLYP